MKITKTVFKKYGERIAAVCAVLSLLLFSIIINGKTTKMQKNINDVHIAVNAIIDEGETIFDEALFVVREKDGKVAIFDYRTGKVIEELNIYTYSLPQTDRTYLENGIMLYTVSELISLIEDYSG
ncbi:MAG: hypothetical protein IKB35_02975 [Clostridia bacterium]|nr:hypothetical protein [Clostridia bacterium]MBR6742669.1 hypothetical protein [Clostridia bacterium]